MSGRHTPSAQTTAPADVRENETMFSVDEMTCSHCSGVVARALKAGLAPGTVFCVDLENQQVTVGGDPELAASLIRDAGYEPALVSG